MKLRFLRSFINSCRNHAEDYAGAECSQNPAEVSAKDYCGKMISPRKKYTRNRHRKFVSSSFLVEKLQIRAILVGCLLCVTDDLVRRVLVAALELAHELRGLLLRLLLLRLRQLLWRLPGRVRATRTMPQPNLQPPQPNQRTPYQNVSYY